MEAAAEPPAKTARKEDSASSLKRLLMSGSPQLQLVEEADGGKRTKSNVWNDFQRIYHNDAPTNFVACCRCRDVLRHVRGHEGSGTSSMQRHMEAHKRNLEGQTSLTSFFGKKGLDGQKNAMKAKLARSMATFCAMDMRPLSAVEGK